MWCISSVLSVHFVGHEVTLCNSFVLSVHCPIADPLCRASYVNCNLMKYMEKHKVKADSKAFHLVSMACFLFCIVFLLLFFYLYDLVAIGLAGTKKTHSEYSHTHTKKRRLKSDLLAAKRF